jgi:hypothetical protein
MRSVVRACRQGANEGPDAHDGDDRGAQFDGEPEPPGRGNGAQYERDGCHREIPHEVQCRNHTPSMRRRDRCVDQFQTAYE